MSSAAEQASATVFYDAHVFTAEYEHPGKRDENSVN
jgi:hypothetical protein